MPARCANVVSQMAPFRCRGTVTHVSAYKILFGRRCSYRLTARSTTGRAVRDTSLWPINLHKRGPIMKHGIRLALVCFVVVFSLRQSRAADSAPALAQQGKQLFADDFARADMAPKWRVGKGF